MIFLVFMVSVSEMKHHVVLPFLRQLIGVMLLDVFTKYVSEPVVVLKVIDDDLYPVPRCPCILSS